MTGRKLCTVRQCQDHRDDPTWLHVPPRREAPLTVWLRGQRRAAA